MKKITALSLLVFSLSPAWSDDDYYTTDFQHKLNTRTGISGFYDYSSALLGDGVTGSSTIQKYGFDVGVLDRLDIYFTSTSNAADLTRTNSYQFGFYSRAIGARFHLLNEDSDGFGLTTGLSYETAYPGAVYKNGLDLLISSPDQESMHGFLLASKKITDRLRLNAGLKMGTAVVGPLKGSSYNWSLGAEYEFSDDWSLQGNFKQIVLEGLPANNDLALRVNWKPTPNVRLQLHGDYYTRGLESQYPVLQPLIPGDAWQRFGAKPQVMLGLNASFNFEVEDDDREKDSKPEDAVDGNSGPRSPATTSSVYPMQQSGSSSQSQGNTSNAATSTVSKSRPIDVGHNNNGTSRPETIIGLPSVNEATRLRSASDAVVPIQSVATQADDDDDDEFLLKPRKASGRGGHATNAKVPKVRLVRQVAKPEVEEFGLPETLPNTINSPNSR